MTQEGLKVWKRNFHMAVNGGVKVKSKYQTCEGYLYNYRKMKEDLKLWREQLARSESGDVHGAGYEVPSEGVSQPVEDWAEYREKLRAGIDRMSRITGAIEKMQRHLVEQGRRNKRSGEMLFVLEWYYFDGMKAEEVSRVSGLSLVTIDERRGEIVRRLMCYIKY